MSHTSILTPAVFDLADSVDALMSAVGPNGYLLFANRLWRERLGYDTTDVTSLRFVDVLDEAQRVRLATAVNRTIDGADLGTINTQMMARSGVPVTVEGGLSRFVVDGRVAGVLALFNERVVRLPGGQSPPFAIPTGRRIALTSRQQAVLQLFASGHTTKQVASELDIAVKTVHNHLTTIYRILDAQSLVQATMIAAQLGLVEPAVPLR